MLLRLFAQSVTLNGQQAICCDHEFAETPQRELGFFFCRKQWRGWVVHTRGQRVTHEPISTTDCELLDVSGALSIYHGRTDIRLTFGKPKGTKTGLVERHSHGTLVVALGGAGATPAPVWWTCLYVHLIPRKGTCSLALKP